MRTILIGVWAATAFAAPAMAHDCVKPVAPVVADKNSLTLEQRNAAVERIDAYIVAMNVFLACLEAQDTVARAEAQAIIDAFEAPIDGLEIVQ